MRLSFNVIPIVSSTTFLFRGCIAFIHSTKKKFNQRNAYTFDITQLSSNSVAIAHILCYRFTCTVS